MKRSINASWHEQHPMPKNPTLAQRAAWHLEHQKHCSCRPIPEKLLAWMDAQGESGSEESPRHGSGGSKIRES